MKTNKIIYWTAAVIFFLFESVMPALTSHTELAVESIRHLGYPDYFRVMLTVFKVAGGIVLILPMIQGRLRQWAYAGFTFNIISATVSHVVVDGVSFQSFFPLIVLAILAVSYVYNDKLQAAKGTESRQREGILA